MDTKLFRELGEYLVGRESTALAELVKNAYDADATRVRVRGTSLDDPPIAMVIVDDDGVGMSREEFERGFLRIGARTRTEGERRSERFKRRFTGAKGVGRLAAHKLAERLDLDSWRWNRMPRLPDGRYPAKDRGLRASIDWSEIERHETLDSVVSGLEVEDLSAGRASRVSGTRLTLTRLRRRWTKSMRDAFLSEVGTLVPLPILVDPPPRTFGGTLLFARPTIRDTAGSDPGFQLELEDELARPDELLEAVPDAAIQVVEIDCDSTKNKIRYGVSPSERFKAEHGAARLIQAIPFTDVLSRLADSYSDPGALAFQARIYERYEKDIWPSYAQGIRVYMEGFRVMPYGDPTDDWLGLKEEYTRRARGAFLRTLEGLDTPAGVRGESAVVRTYQAYAGAVYLRQNAAPGLQMVVNREGFLPTSSLSAVKEIIRIGIDLATRVRYAATQSVSRARAENAPTLASYAATSNVRQPPSAALYHDNLTSVLAAVREARVAASAGNATVAREKLKSVDAQSEILESLTGEAAAEQSMLRVLGSVGTQLSAFSHEIGQLVSTAKALVEHLEVIADQLDNSQKRQIRFGVLRRNADLLLRGIERQAVYLVDVIGVAGRRRRSRLVFRERFEAAQRLVAAAIEKQKIDIQMKIPEELASPPMFPAELTMVFTNLLTNAVKAAKENGKILLTGRERNDEIVVRLENTGEAVNLGDAERWFRPFQSRTKIPHAVLGQGMGLGLTITRSILDEYGASIAFVRPTQNYKTAIEMRFRKR